MFVMDKIDKKMKYFAVSIDIDTAVTEHFSDDFRTARISFTRCIPRILSVFNDNNIKATFFIIARFAQDRIIAKIIREIANEGHEIANHSFSHNKHLSELDYKETYWEIARADKILSDIIGKKIYGFRAPGYTLSVSIIKVLKELEYTYDASLNPSKFYFLLKLFWKNYFLKDAHMLNVQPYSHCLLPSHPFFINEKHIQNQVNESIDDCSLLEIPVSVISGISYPMIGILLNRSEFVARILCWLARRNVNANILLHDMEFADHQEFNLKDNVNAHFASSNVNRRLKLYNQIISDIRSTHNFVTLGEMTSNHTSISLKENIIKREYERSILNIFSHE